MTTIPVQTEQSTKYYTAAQYRSIVSPSFIVLGKDSLTVHQKINLRNNMNVCAWPCGDLLRLKNQ